jgi:hypothetical protein
MPSRSGVDGQQGSHLMIELKSAPRRTSPVSSFGLHRMLPSRARWLHIVPVACLLFVGAAVPGFLLTLVILLFSLAVALGVFLFLVQLPVGYLVHRWRDLRGSNAARRHSRRGAPSKGL